LGFLGDGVLPTPAAAPPVDAGLKTILDAVEEDRSMAELEPLLAKVSHSDVEEELRAARDRTREFDVRLGPVNRVTDQLEAALARQLTLLPDSQMQFVAGLAAAVPADADPNVRRTAGAFVTACRAVQADTVRQVYRDFTSARLRYAAARYDAEARLNQVIANLYEVQVRKNNLSAERHHTRSQRFFYGMLAAQMAVIMATFAMAARKRNLLWGLAAAAGVAAVAFAAYVYLYV
jgi:hypothetical protein